MAEMHRPHVLGPAAPALDNYFIAYAMGWQCRDSPNGPLVLHEGGEFGVSTFTLLDPQRKTGVAVYANLNRSAGTKAVAYALIDVLAGREPRDWAGLFEKLLACDLEMIAKFTDARLAPFAQAAPSTRDIVGSYFNAANGMVDISETAEGLDARVREGWVYDSVLKPAEGNLFVGLPRFRGMQGMAGKGGSQMRIFRDEQGLAIQAPGLGIMRKVG
jgi:hypothetical protein